MSASDGRPIPKKNVAYRVTFPIFDADGDLVSGASSLDSEVSKDGGTFADCTNEATEIATNSGMYYLDLTATEMNADTVAIIIKTDTAGAKTTPIVLYPEEAGDIRVDVTQISGDTTAADNLEADYDGTGYNKANSTIGTVTNVTNEVSADVIKISGDGTAADNLELDYDGTGYAKANSTIGTCTANTDMRGTDNALLAANVPTNFADLAITASTGKITVGTNDDKTGYDLNADQSAVTVGTVTTVTTCTTNSDMRGTDNALLAASAPTNFADLAITASTGKVTVGTNDDKTGYDLNADQSAVTIGTVTTVTNEVSADMIKISGDATAADNLEAAFDGTGGVQMKLSQLYIDNPSGNALHCVSSGGNGHGIYGEGEGSGHGNYNKGGETGFGQYNHGPVAGHGQYNHGVGIGYNGQRIFGNDDHGSYSNSGGLSKHGAYYKAGDGDGIRVEGGTNGNGLNCIKAGSGYDIDADIHGTIDTCTTNTDMRGTDNALLAASAPANFGDLAITASTGKVTVGTNDDKTGYDLNADQSAVTVGTVTTVTTCTTNSDMRGTDNALLAASAPANFADLAITASTGKVTVGTNDDKTGYSISGTKQTLDALNDISAADVNTQVDTALSDINLDHLMKVAVTGGDVTDDSVIAKLVSKSATADWDTFDNTTDSLEAVSDAITAGSVDWTAGEKEQIRDALGVDGSKTTATGGQLQTIDSNVDAIKAKTDDLAFTAGNVHADIQEYNTHPDVDLNADQSAVTVGTVTTVTTCTTNSDMRGTDNALLAASAPANFADLAITVTTGLVSVGTNNDKTGYDLNADQSAVTIGTVTTNTDMRGTDNALLAANAPANFADLAITASTGLVSVGTNNDKTGYDLNADQSAVTVGTVTTVTTCTTNTDMRGTDNALLAASAPANFSDLAITASTGLVSVGTNNDKTGYDLNADQSAVTIGTVTTNTDMRGTDNALLAANAPANFADLAITASTGKVTVGTNDDKTGYALTTAEHDAIVDKVWDELQSGHTDAGSFGEYLDAKVSDCGSALTAQQIRDAMKLAPTGGAPAAGSVDAHLDTIEADTNEIQGKLPSGNISDFNPATDEVDIGKVKGVAVTNINDFKADVSALATEANATANKVAVIAEVDANEVKIDSLQADTTKLRQLIENPWKYDFTGAIAIAKLRNTGDSADIATQPVYKEDGTSKPTNSAQIATRGLLEYV